MQRLRSFVESRPGYVLRLPTSWLPRATTQGSEAHFPLFNAVFDAAAIGQWAGGADPMHEAIRGYCCFLNTIGCVCIVLSVHVCLKASVLLCHAADPSALRLNIFSCGSQRREVDSYLKAS